MRIAVLALLLSALAAPAMAQPEVNFPDPVIQAAREQFVAGDHAAALAILRPLAEGGAVRAQNILGTAYQYGNGVAADQALALQWYGRAAGQGYPTALHNLGYLFEVGMPGLQPDQQMARSYYQQAGALDYGPSLGNLGGMMLVGIGGPVDHAGAIAVLRRGVQMGDPNAVEWLAWASVTGSGVPEDMSQARRLYEIAALHDRPNAANEYGMLLADGQGGPVDLVRAMQFYEQAVAGDIGYAGINAAWMIFDHPDLFSDHVLGLAYCFWAVAIATEPDRTDYDIACNEAAQDYTSAEVAAARKRAQSL